ncbi:MAG: hypothetical protein Q8O72_14830 [Bacteroidales bacterium]|jgi:hypothetical protein|nr:hypothetical protein [Bacteroidales bacterium]
MNTKPNSELDSFFTNIITSYEDRVQKIQTAFQSSENLTESSHELFNNVHNHINELKHERVLLNARLCEAMSKNGSLRKKDYHNMMSDILNLIDEKENEAQHQFLVFIEEQKETARTLKECLLGLKDITSHDIGEKIAAIKEQLSHISKQQEMRKETVMNSYQNFQRVHLRLTGCLESLLKKEEHILVKDLKMIKDQIINGINLNTQVANGIN